MIPVLTTYVVPVIHVIACLFLIVVVLLQTGKGADMGAVFGGGSQTLFGSSGAGNFLTKLTTGSAIIFMVTSLSLSYLTANRGGERLFDEETPAGSAPERPGFEEVGTVPAEAGAEAGANAAPAQAGTPAAPEPARK